MSRAPPSNIVDLFEEEDDDDFEPSAEYSETNETNDTTEEESEEGEYTGRCCNSTSEEVGADFM